MSFVGSVRLALASGALFTAMTLAQSSPAAQATYPSDLAPCSPMLRRRSGDRASNE